MVMNADQAFGFATPSVPIAIKNLNYNIANVIITFGLEIYVTKTSRGN